MTDELERQLEAGLAGARNRAPVITPVERQEKNNEKGSEVVGEEPVDELLQTSDQGIEGIPIDVYSTLPEPKLGSGFAIHPETELPTIPRDKTRLVKTLQRLREWASWSKQRELSLWGFTKSALARPPSFPEVEDLVELCLHTFPLWHKTIVEVYDFGRNGYKRALKVPISKAPDYFGRKPPESTVRWIHVPIQSGPAANAIVDTFSFFGEERSVSHISLESNPRFKNAGTFGFSSLDFRIVDIRNRSLVQDQWDVFKILSQEHPSTKQLNSRLEELVFPFSGVNQKLCDKVRSCCREAHSGLSFWEMAEDMLDRTLFGTATQQLVASSNFSGSSGKFDVSIDQFLCRHSKPSSFHRDSVLVSNGAVTTHSRNGYLMTMSSAIGVEIASMVKSKTPNMCLTVPVDESSFDRCPTVRGTVCNSNLDEFSWTSPELSLECLIGQLVLEWHNTPNYGPMLSDSLANAYADAIQDLKSKQNDLTRGSAVRLVRDYADCIEELSTLTRLAKEREEFLSRLRKDYQAMLKNKETPAHRGLLSDIDDTITDLRTERKNIDITIADVKSSLNTFFQIRSMHQNELALAAEAKNTAILIFTVVTIIFLPLSFFTSYYGMNLVDIRDLDKQQRDFWSISGPVTIGIVLITTAFAFKESISARVLKLLLSLGRT